MKFSNIIGHEILKDKLSKISGEAQTYLFYGPPSIGKRTIADKLAHYILCSGSKEDECKCKSCSTNDHPDFLNIGTNGKVLVADVDNLIDFVSRAPLCSETKVIIIDNVDVISIEAANRLLKTLEESPFVFFLITSKFKNVLPTVRSRCIKFQFEALKQDDVINILWKKMGFELNQARVIGWIGAGSSSDIFSCAGLYLKYSDMVIEFFHKLMGKDFLSVLEFIDKIPRPDLPIFIDLLVLLLTDMLLLKNNMDDIINSDRREELIKLNVLPVKVLLIVLNNLTQVKINSHLNINLNLAFKSALIKVWSVIKA